MTTRTLLFGSPHTLDTHAAHGGLAVLRVFAGLALALAHGLGKIPPSDGFVGMLGGLGVPAPGVAALLSGAAEFGGGILLAAGLLTRPAALLIAINMTVAVLMAHAGQTFSERELPLMFLAVAVAFVLTGPGRYSVDAAIAGRDVPRRRR
jgi:putative oxidoreductase